MKLFYNFYSFFVKLSKKSFHKVYILFNQSLSNNFLHFWCIVFLQFCSHTNYKYFKEKKCIFLMELRQYQINIVRDLET